MARGSVTKRGNLWNILYTIAPDPETDKLRQRRESGFSTKREAQERLTAALREMDRHQPRPTAAHRGRYLIHWYETANEPSVLVTSAVVNERDLRLRLIPALGHLRLTALGAAHIARLHRDLAATSLAHKTSRRTHATLHAAPA